MSDATDAPRQIGKYRLDGLLGKGAMGMVYRAHDPLIERTVALKTVRRDFGDGQQSGELIARFRKEAQAAGRLMHPNIVAVLDYGESDDTAYIAMEFVDGTPLSTLLGEGPTPLAQALDWCSDLLAALDYSHARGVVHRDIKPANLLVTRDGRIKVSDFGIARIESSTLTQHGAMLGTPSYMAPEQFRGDAVDGRSDLFSAGIVLYQLLTGKRPFSGSTATVMQQVLNLTPPLPSHWNAALPPGLDAVVMQALAKDASDRHATARAFQLALTTAARDGAVADSDATVLMAPAAPAARTGWAERPPQQSRPGTGGMTGNQPAWLQATGPHVEVLLARQIGPMAKLLLRRIAQSAPDFATLGQQLATHIPSPAARAQFERQMVDIGVAWLPPTQQASSGQVPGTLPPQVTPAFAAAVTPLLAAAIGPIATVVVKRALPRAANRADFLALLAEQIEASLARDRFLAQVALLPTS
jgi:predicted Ser/Thr protein kinase